MFIARQPIFNKELSIFGYELLFRGDLSSKGYDSSSSVSATAKVIGGLFETGIEHVVGKARAFVNFDYDFIMSDGIELIDPNTLVIEVLETVEVDQCLIERLKSLKKKGYKIALDDFEESYQEYAIVPIADIIKYDIMITPLHTIQEDVKTALSQNKVILAEKIETNEEYQEALAMGFHLFQGYFFSKPSIVEKSKDEKSSKVQYARILNEIRKPEPSYDEITKIIESDVDIAYRLIKVMSHRKQEDMFRSIHKVLVTMGLKELERWIRVLMLQDFSKNKPIEITRMSLIRSKFSEFIAKNSTMKGYEDQTSMMALFSMIDVLLECPMEEALEGMMLPNSVVQALVYHKGQFFIMCELIQSYEKGDWGKIPDIAESIQMNPIVLSEGYLKAVEWANEIFESLE